MVFSAKWYFGCTWVAHGMAFNNHILLTGHTVCTPITNSTGGVSYTAANNTQAASKFKCNDGFYLVDSAPATGADYCAGVFQCVR